MTMDTRRRLLALAVRCLGDLMIKKADDSDCPTRAPGRSFLLAGCQVRRAEWDRAPLEPCDQENFLCIYQERRK